MPGAPPSASALVRIPAAPWAWAKCREHPHFDHLKIKRKKPCPYPRCSRLPGAVLSSVASRSHLWARGLPLGLDFFCASAPCWPRPLPLRLCPWHSIPASQFHAPNSAASLSCLGFRTARPSRCTPQIPGLTRQLWPPERGFSRLGPQHSLLPFYLTWLPRLLGPGLS